MKVRLSQGRVARARFARGIPVNPSAPSPFPPSMIAILPESDPKSWPNYILDWDDDGVPHIVDVDASIEWDGWRVPEFDQIEEGDL